MKSILQNDGNKKLKRGCFKILDALRMQLNKDYMNALVKQKLWVRTQELGWVCVSVSQSVCVFVCV